MNGRERHDRTGCCILGAMGISSIHCKELTGFDVCIVWFFCGNSIRRRFSRGLPKKYSVLLKKLRKAKKECPMHEKPEVVKTHLRNMIIMPEMIGSVVGVYSGKSYIGVEVKAEMVGTYLAEYSMSYKPVKHGRPGIGATASSKFVPLK